MKEVQVALLYLFGSAFLFGQQQAGQPNAVQNYRHGVVHIGKFAQDGKDESGKSQTPKVVWLGTGFLVDDRCTFATAKHLLSMVRDGEQLVIRFRLPTDLLRVKTLKGRILYQDPSNDLAFVTVVLDRCVSTDLYIFPLVPQERLSSLLGESVVIIGHPKVTHNDVDIPVVRTGTISSAEITWKSQPMLLLDLAGVPGFSGSPVILLRTGEVVGVVYGPGVTERVYGFEWATPLTAQKFLNIQTELQLLLSPPTPTSLP